ncbi:hypothetical protein D4764_20G0006990 [Takifugu flavidus]|uniref:Uncharacterized protein n=1 Tax=Takifugu flavidus TaxID=433684 RepID=A0A5C6NLV2_9TELE|nr:hypothetical protein D4764_20G0006990 [Takifugu flavidus]
MGNLADRVGPKKRLAREGGSLQQHLLADTGDKCDCLLSLEAFSADQKRRVCQCLKDNIDKQLQLQRREPHVPHFEQNLVQNWHIPVQRCRYPRYEGSLVP